MAKSAVLNQKKEEKLKDFEEIEAIELTEKEQEGISRSLLLRWYRSNKLAKIKGFQLLLQRELTPDELDEMRKTIAKNTKRELLKEAKGLDKAQIEKKAEKFADEIVAVSDSDKNLDELVAKQAILEEEEKIFFKTLDEYAGKRKLKGKVDNLFDTKEMKEVLAVVKAKDPSAYEDIQIARKKGDYKEIRSLIADGSDGMLSESAVDKLLTAIALGSLKGMPKANFTSMRGILATLDKLRAVGHTFALKRAAKDSKVSFTFVLQFAGKTFNEMQQMNNRLKGHQYLIEGKENKSTNDIARLAFINNVNTLTESIEKGLTDDMQNTFEDLLKQHLEKKKMSERDRAYVLAHAKLKDLTMIQLYELIYAPDKDRNRWFFRTISRMHTMRRAWKKTLGESREFHKSMVEYSWKRTKRGISYYKDVLFTKKYKKWGMEKIAGELDELESLAKRNNQTAQEFLDSKMAIPTNELFDADILLKRYREVTKRATRHMSREAKKILALGKTIEELRARKLFYPDMNLDEFFQNSQSLQKHKEVIESMFDGASLASKKGADLIGAYGNKIVDIKTMHDTTRARFSAVSELIEQNVTSPLNKKWGIKREFLKGTVERSKLRADVADIKDLVSPTNKIKYGFKKLALPGLIVGTELYALASGKAKTREVLWDLGEAGAGFLPVVGTALDFKAAFTGRSLSGRRMGAKERMLSGFFGAIGLVADAATIFGGLGLGLRAGIGGMKGAAKTARAIKTADHIRDAANAAEGGWLLGKVKKFGKFFSKAHRIEKVGDANVTLKAYKQAELVADLRKAGTSLKGGENLDELLKTEAGIMKLKKLNKGTSNASKIDKLLDITKVNGSFIDYKKLFETHKLGGKSLEISRNIVGKTWTKTKLQFLKVKKWLHQWGVGEDVIKGYEKSFDAMQSAQKARLIAIENLKQLELTKGIKIQEKQKAFDVATSKLGGVKDEFAEVLSHKRILQKKQFQLQYKQKKTGQRFEKLSKNHIEAHNMTLKDLKLRKVKFKDSELESLRVAYQKYNSELFHIKYEQLYQNENRIKKLTKTKDVALAKEFESVEKISDEIFGLEKGILRAKTEIRNVNETIHNLNKVRSINELKMLQTSEIVLRFGDELKVAASYMQKAGLYMGAIWMFTSLTESPLNPVKQMQYAGKAVGMGGRVAGGISNELLFADHSRAPLDMMIQDRVNSFKRMGEIDGKIASIKDEGGNIYKYYAKHWNDKYVREHASRNGVDLIKINRWEQKISPVNLAKAKMQAGVNKAKEVRGIVKEKLGSGKQNV